MSYKKYFFIIIALCIMLLITAIVLGFLYPNVEEIQRGTIYTYRNHFNFALCFTIIVAIFPASLFFFMLCSILRAQELNFKATKELINILDKSNKV